MNKKKVYILEDRGILFVQGIDAKEFLQNLITNDIDKVNETNSCFASLLTPQGKYLFDFLIVKHKNGYFLECEKIQIEKYHSLPDPWESNYICLDNFVCAMYSKKQLRIMVKNSHENFDYIVYLRPDVRYLNNIDIRYFHHTHKNVICTPNFHLFPQLNDRLAILKPYNLKEYSEMFNEMYEYSRIFPLHS